MRVCIWYWGRRGAGVRLTRELAEALLPQHELSLSLSSYCEQPPDIASDLPVHTVRTYRNSREFALSLARLAGVLSSLRAFLDRADPDIILVPMLAPWQALLLPFLGHWRTKTVVTVHDPEPHPGASTAAIDWLSTRLAVHWAGRVVAPTAHSAERLRALSPAWRRIEVVPLGIPAQTGAGARARPFPAHRPFRFLFFGRLEAYKGLDILAGATRLLKEQDGWELEIVGSGPAAASLERDLRDDPRIRLRLEWVPENEIENVVGAADCLVCPYTEASQSGVIPQAIGAAVPSIVTPVGALPEQIEFGELGLVSGAATSQALAQAMQAIMADARRYESFSRASAEAARDRYGWPRLVGRLLGDAQATDIRSFPRELHGS